MSLNWKQSGVSYLVHTIMGISVIDAYFISKAMDKYKMPLAEVLKVKDLVKYRVIIMCPPHLVSKWVKEVNKEIPYAKAIALTDFKQLVEIRANGRERTGKEVYVMSKDFGKLSYMDMPAVTQLTKKPAYVCTCSKCGKMKPMSYKGVKCDADNCDGDFLIEPDPVDNALYKGFKCPSCGQLLCTPAHKTKYDERVVTLSEIDFTEHNTFNDHCWACGESLWQPYVKNIGSSNKQPKWVRMTHYANAAKKAKKTVWVFGKAKNDYFARIRQKPLADHGGDGGCRKYAPASYIKKYLKGFFDFAVFDEVHQYKSGGSAQGNAMGSLIAASKYQIGLTGTIAGGYATHLFSLLFRLDPGRMRSKGFRYNSETAFAEEYGTVERDYEGVESYSSNKMSKGKQLSSPKVKPGISPKIFTDFLLDRAVFLDLSDMSRYLPPLKEKVVLVDTEDAIAKSYFPVIQRLKEMSKTSGQFGLLGSMLQFSLSYTDKPYGVKPIVSPSDGMVVDTPADLSYLVDDGKLLNKEKELVRIVNAEQAEGRNVVIFAEYTNSEDTCITERLKDVIEKNCGLYGAVQIIQSSSPEAIKREEWLHQKAYEGIKVFITNPKILETGVDLCFKHKGVLYNYPTIIFYQMGYSLFTIWQASRRHYRLNQREECRTYYMASKKSVQPAVIRLIAEKQVATSAIQGKFSSEGIAAMAEGVDVKLKLAQALAENDLNHQDELQNMFDVLADVDEQVNSDYEPMSTYYELTGFEEPKPEDIVIPNFIDFSFSVLNSDVNENFSFGLNLFEDFKIIPNETAVKVEDGGSSINTADLPKVKGAGDTLSIFDLIK